MPIDNLYINGLCTELNKKLSGARIDKIYMPRRDQVVLNLRTEKGAKRLILSIGAYPAVWITEQKYENPDVPPMFCMLLRKQIGNGRIVSVMQPGRERIIIITLTATDEMGDISEKKLICELMGKQKNIIVVNSKGTITACLRNVGIENSDRGILPGLVYVLPNASDKPDWMTLSEKQIKDLFDNASATDVEKSICAQVSGLTLAVVRQAMSAAEPYKWLFNTAHSDIKPYLVYKTKDGSKEAVDISAVEPFDEYDVFDSFSEALDAFYGKKSTLDGIKSAKRETEKILNNARKRLENKLSGQRIELKTAQDRDKIKEKADLITANIGTIKNGERLVRVINYYDPLMPEISIDLDPMYSPQQNAQRLYKKYSRLKSAEAHLLLQIDKGERELEYINSLLYALTVAETSSEINTVKDETREAGLIKKDKKKIKPAPSSPRRFITDGGFTVLCGRNNKENDELTHRIAAKRDIWFHARGIAGSHVVLITDGVEPADSDILQAASVAAYYCAVNGVTVPVDYTLVKNVKKPNGGRPGAVNYFEYKSILVKPELPRNEK